MMLSRTVQFFVEIMRAKFFEQCKAILNLFKMHLVVRDHIIEL